MNGKHIVIADDDMQFAKALTELLQKNEYVVDGIVSDGIDAVALCTEKNCDVLFIKENTAFMDGFKAASCLKGKGFEGSVFIVADEYDPDMTAKALAAGAEGCIVKPVTEKFLIPWLYTKLKRSGDISRLSKEKQELLSSLEAKRIIEEANGIIAASAGVSVSEADKILSKKAEAGGTSRESLARILVSSVRPENK